MKTVFLLTALIFASAVSSSRPSGGGAECTVAGNSDLWKDFVEARKTGREPVLPDFSYAGYRYSESPIPEVAGPLFRVTDYGAVPDDDGYDDAAIQQAIDAAAAAGGGVVLFPRGRFRVSPSQDKDAHISISGSRVVLRGAGPADGGTEILMVNMKPGGTMLRVAPRTSESRPLAAITADARRETFSVLVDTPAAMRVGQRIVIKHQDPTYNAQYWAPLELDPRWERIYRNGPPFHEVHTVASIEGNRVQFAEPLHFTIRMNAAPFRLHSIDVLEEIGIEDIRFTGGWDTYAEAFVHHKDAIHDAAWTMLGVIRVANGWVRRVEFRNVNQAIHGDTPIAFTFDRVRFTGKKGHTSISTRRGYGVLVRDSEDAAAHHHGPGFGYQGVGSVYLRHRMQRDQRIDSHGGNPYASLLDDVTGGVLDGNGGPYPNYPHHSHYFVFWNFAHRASREKTYDFWNIAKRNSSTFFRPIVAGLTSDRPVGFVDAEKEMQKNESQGTPVTPRSLFEAQLRLRLCR